MRFELTYWYLEISYAKILCMNTELKLTQEQEEALLKLAVKLHEALLEFAEQLRNIVVIAFEKLRIWWEDYRRFGGYNSRWAQKQKEYWFIRNQMKFLLVE